MKKNEDYVKLKGTECPYCNSFMIMTQPPKHNPKRPNVVTSECHCDSCGKDWIDEFELFRYLIKK